MEDSQTKGSEPIAQDAQNPSSTLHNTTSEKPSAVTTDVSASEQPASAEDPASLAATPDPATKVTSKNGTSEPSPSVEIPKWPGDLHEIRPEVRRVSYHHFKNLRGDNESKAAIYALYGETSLKADIKKEQEFRKRSSKLPKLSNTEDIEASTVGKLAPKNNVLHRIRINSAFILKHLHYVSDASWEHPKHYVFFRPFRPLIELQNKMKEELENLQKKWGSADTTEKEPTGDKPSLNADSRELLDSREALRHMEVYVDFIENDVMPLCKMFDDRKRTRVAYHDLWYLFRTGDYVYRPLPMNTKKKVSASGPSTSNSSIMATYQTLLRAYSILIPPTSLDPDEELSDSTLEFFPWDDSWSSGHGCVIVHSYYIEFDGDSYIPACLYEKIDKYDDEKEITDLNIYPLVYHPDKDTIMRSQTESGKRFRQLIETKHVYHFGWTVSHEPGGWEIEDKSDYRRHVDSEFIVDYSEAFKNSPHWEPSSYNPCDGLKKVSSIDWETSHTSDAKLKTRVWSTQTDQFDDVAPDENCKFVHLENVGLVKMCDFLKSNRFFQSLEKDEEPILGDDELCLLPKKLVGFALRDREFVNVEMRSLRPLTSHKNVWKMLKIDVNNRTMVQSLVKEHFRKKDALKEAQNSRKVEELEMANQDAVRGKGAGLVFLLHGVPGVGKTATAEAVAQENKRPLFSITCGDLGIEPVDVERNLSRIFRLASLWDCVLLLDEADIFFTRRTPTDLQRNALVTVFLRVLEYYSGVLFLTTNRVGLIDEAFKSRIHVYLYYNDLDWEQTRQIFQYNIDRVRELEELEKEDIRLIIDEPSIMSWAEQHFKQNARLGRWNGRQIRNAFQTAVSLAHYDGQDDDLAELDRATGRKKLTNRHFSKVFATTQQFEIYIARIQAGTDREVAHHYRTRLDDQERPAPANRPPQYGQIPGPQSPTPTPLGSDPRHPSETSPGLYRTPHRQMPHYALDGGSGGSPMLGYGQQSMGARLVPIQPSLTSSHPATSMGYQTQGSSSYLYGDGERSVDSSAQSSRQATMNLSPSDVGSDVSMAERKFDPYQGNGANLHNYMVDNRTGL